MDLKKLKIGYLPYRTDLSSPGDRRRFAYYAKKRDLSFEVVQPGKKYDLVILSQKADLSVWSSRKDLEGTKIVYDFIDSYLAVPRKSLKGNLRGLAKFLSRQSKFLRLNHWSALETMCKNSDAVICSTQEQQNSISKFNKNVHLILDVHSAVTTNVKTNYKTNDVFNLVWEGLGVNVYSLAILKNVIAKLQKKYKIAFHVITDLEYKKYLGLYGKVNTAEIVKKDFNNIFLYEWTEETCSKIICESDLAVIPIDMVDPLVRGKPENKLLLFWRMGMPVISSATPVYVRATKAAGFPDMVCRTEDEWIETIEKYILSEEKRRAAGMAGKALADSSYSEEIILQKWDNLFASLFPNQ